MQGSNYNLFDDPSDGGSRNFVRQDRHGKGYRLTINFKEWKGEQTQIIDELFGLGCQVVNDLGSRIMLKVAK